jgi:hypothetical protein
MYFFLLLKVEEDFQKKIVVFQNEIEIKNGSTLHSFNDIVVKLEPKIFQMVLELRGGFTFKNGLCDGKRINTNTGAIVELSTTVANNVNFQNFNNIIQIVAVWSKSYSSGVKIAEPFFLTFNKNIIPEL